MQSKAAFRVVIWVTLSMLLLCGTEPGFTSKKNRVFFKFPPDIIYRPWAQTGCSGKKGSGEWCSFDLFQNGINLGKTPLPDTKYPRDLFQSLWGLHGFWGAEGLLGVLWLPHCRLLPGVELYILAVQSRTFVVPGPPDSSIETLLRSVGAFSCISSMDQASRVPKGTCFPLCQAHPMLS